MKGYMESGEFSRGKESIRADGSIEPIHNAVTLAEIAIEKGAQALLMPVTCWRQLHELSDEMAQDRHPALPGRAGCAAEGAGGVVRAMWVGDGAGQPVDPLRRVQVLRAASPAPAVAR